MSDESVGFGPWYYLIPFFLLVVSVILSWQLWKERLTAPKFAAIFSALLVVILLFVFRADRASVVAAGGVRLERQIDRAEREGDRLERLLTQLEEARSAIQTLLSSSFFGILCDPEHVSRFLDLGVPSGIQTRGGQSALAVAVARCRDPAIIRVLLDYGADPNATDADGRTALHAAAEVGGAAGAEMIRLSLQEGASPDAADQQGTTALHLAGSAEAIDALIDGGADADSRNNQGETALLLAVRGDREEVALALLRRKASPREADRNGDTPLHLAATPVIVANLIAQDAEVDARNHLGETPLILAVQHDRRDAFALLLSAKASPSTADAEGWTPLMYAVGKRPRDWVGALLGAGADPNARSAVPKVFPVAEIKREPLRPPGAVRDEWPARTTSLMIAARRPVDIGVIQWHRCKGADPFVTNGAGVTASDYARQRYTDGSRLQDLIDALTSDLDRAACREADQMVQRILVEEFDQGE